MNRAKWKTLLYILKAHDSKIPQVVTYTPPKADFNLDSLYAARKAYEDRMKGGWLR